MRFYCSIYFVLLFSISVWSQSISIDTCETNVAIIVHEHDVRWSDGNIYIVQDDDLYRFDPVNCSKDKVLDNWSNFRGMPDVNKWHVLDNNFEPITPSQDVERFNLDNNYYCLYSKKERAASVYQNDKLVFQVPGKLQLGAISNGAYVVTKNGNDQTEVYNFQGTKLLTLDSGYEIMDAGHPNYILVGKIGAPDNKLIELNQEVKLDNIDSYGRVGELLYGRQKNDARFLLSNRSREIQASDFELSNQLTDELYIIRDDNYKQGVVSSEGVVIVEPWAKRGGVLSCGDKSYILLYDMNKAMIYSSEMKIVEETTSPWMTTELYCYENLAFYLNMNLASMTSHYKEIEGEELSCTGLDGELRDRGGVTPYLISGSAEKPYSSTMPIELIKWAEKVGAEYHIMAFGHRQLNICTGSLAPIFDRNYGLIYRLSENMFAIGDQHGALTAVRLE